MNNRVVRVQWGPINIKLDKLICNPPFPLLSATCLLILSNSGYCGGWVCRSVYLRDFERCRHHQFRATNLSRIAHFDDRDVWREAGVLAGLLARLQGYGRRERRKALNDALIFLTAAKNGCAVLTRNLADFDLLMQLDPRGRAIFYQRT